MSTLDLYAEPQVVTSLDDCIFYHTMEIPGYGLVRGQWDLRANIHKYLGGVELENKRVLEIGTASGFVCTHMEKHGAEVVAFDLSEDEDADVVPFARHDVTRLSAQHREFMKKIRNGFWLNHAAHRSMSKVVYGTAYRLPHALGPVDVCIFGAVLRHLRDPLLALQRAAQLTRETLIVTESMNRRLGLLVDYVRRRISPGAMIFLPRVELDGPTTTWWALSPTVIARCIKVLGFEDVTVKYHYQHRENVGRTLFWTVIGRRTQAFTHGSTLVLPS
jgi:SAM-dependent methyltransferase